MMRYGLIACVVMLAGDAMSKDAYQTEIDTWHQKRTERLKSPEGWLALAGLFWLEEGDNRFGAASDNALVFPKDRAPQVAGVLKRAGKRVDLSVSPGVTITHDGKAVSTMTLASDKAGAPTTLKLGSLSFFVIERGDKVGLRVRDAKNPALESFTGIERYPVDASWRFTARFEPYTPAKKIDIPTVMNTIEASTCPGALVFERDGQTHKLDVIQEEGDSELFVIFADKTNGKETYGPGRFVYVPLAKDGTTTLDLNKAYNPPCAFTPYATCPLPPPQNRLPIRVTAGEKNYGHH